MIKQQTSNEYGISQQLLTLSFLCNYGNISIPYGNNARYDCILDLNSAFYRIQIKSLNLIDQDTIIIPMRNGRLSGEGHVEKTYTSEQVDYISIYYNNMVYLFNPDLAQQTLTVRIHKPQKENQRWIEDYSFFKVFNIELKTWTSLKEQTRIKERFHKKIKKYNCIDCGAPVWDNNTRCVTCARIFASSKSSKPSREILKEKIKNTPFTQIGLEYGVTDNAVRKWCKSYNLPSRVIDIKNIIKRGEWELV